MLKEEARSVYKFSEDIIEANVVQTHKMQTEQNPNSQPLVYVEIPIDKYDFDATSARVL